jgi:hypothetical protein
MYYVGVTCTRRPHQLTLLKIQVILVELGIVSDARNSLFAFEKTVGRLQSVAAEYTDFPHAYFLPDDLLPYQISHASTPVVH